MVRHFDEGGYGRWTFGVDRIIAKLSGNFMIKKLHCYDQGFSYQSNLAPS